MPVLVAIRPGERPWVVIDGVFTDELKASLDEGVLQSLLEDPMKP
jgi:hypothetical protein